MLKKFIHEAGVRVNYRVMKQQTLAMESGAQLGFELHRKGP